MELSIAHSALVNLQAIQEYYREQGVPDVGDEYVTAILEHCQKPKRNQRLLRSGA